jgi:hypothetical protein
MRLPAMVVRRSKTQKFFKPKVERDAPANGIRLFAGSQHGQCVYRKELKRS